MGDPRKQRKKYDRPKKIWNKENIDSEKILMREYGLKNKEELWKFDTMLRNFRKQAKNLIAKRGEGQADKEGGQLIAKIVKLNILKPDSILEDVLGLNNRSLLDRRLQTIVLKKGLAKSVKQARQFVVHGHISVGENKVNVPSYLVKSDEENIITFSGNSSLSKEDHPERIKESKKVKEEKRKISIEDKDAVELFEESEESIGEKIQKSGKIKEKVIEIEEEEIKE